MIKLKNVSKFYYSKGVIASGFSKVSLNLKIGEFVAITGESGSGKSTLLNVISGLDSYEEGEMYINGAETSHYIEKDWEDYRRKYIGNIYQNFNLINSYTVYQNIELVLILNGQKRKEARPKVVELIKKIGLEKFKNTKVSKLSGGQKQRVAIARALAKDVPIIIADEPTGNLDKRSAESIIKLLSEIAKDRLVIIVTHNYEQVENYITRKITMHDGKILEDKVIKPIEEKHAVENNYQNISFINKLKLGVRNAFNVTSKFLLLFAVYAFIVASLMGEYSSFKKEEYQYSKYGNNYIFQDTSDNRIIIKKKDKSAILRSEYEALNKLENISYIMENDLLVERYTTIETLENNLTVGGTAKSIKQFTGKVDIGRLPKNDYEIIVAGFPNDYFLANKYDTLLNSDFHISDDYNLSSMEENKIKIVGIQYYDDDIYRDYELYFSDVLIKEYQYRSNQEYSNITVNFMGVNHQSKTYDKDFRITPNKNVPSGSAYISEDYSLHCDKNNCLNKSINVDVKNIYYTDSLTLNISKTYNRKTIEKLLGFNKISDDEYYEEYNGSIYVNYDDYYHLFDKENYQSSVYVKDVQLIDESIAKLNDLGYDTLAMKDVMITPGSIQALRIIKIIVTIVLIVTLFFITYFIIKLILKSRNIYFSTIRMLGASKKVARHLLIIELLVVSNLAYFVFVLLAYFNQINLISVAFIDTVNTYFHFQDYILMYIIITIMSLLISEKYASQLFKNSIMSAYREEV